MRDRDLVSFLYNWILRLPNTIYHGDCLFSKVHVFHLCQKLGGYSYMNLILDTVLSHWSTCLFSVPCCFITMTLWYSLKPGKGILSAWFLLLRIILENPGLWCDHMNFRLPFLLLWIIIWNFSGRHIETIGQFESIPVFTVLILLTYKYKRPLH